MKISVTSLDLKRGVPFEAENCPVTRATKRALNRSYKGAVEANEDVINVISARGNLLVQYNTPETARNFITRFDYGLPTKPFSFSLPAKPN